eukprot:GEMP01031603.1.p1 GENE.GEMP01031603.1~~GEMP01031603.1.p1  ORF type:complete len:433 (+),score=92.89 GEMP01031603.1:24-1322(+)
MNEFLRAPLVLESAKAFLQHTTIESLLRAPCHQGLEALERLLFFEEIRNDVVNSAELAPLFVEFGKHHQQLFFDTLLKMDSVVLNKLQIDSLIVDGLCSTDLAMVTLASKLALNNDNQRFISDMFPLLKERRATASDEVRFRVLQLCLDAAKQGAVVDEAMQWVLDECFTTDVLLKLNAVELLAQFGVFPAGIEFLERSQATRKLEAELDACFDLTLEVTIVRLLILLSRKDGSAHAALQPRLVAYQTQGQIQRLTSLFGFGHLVGAGWDTCLDWPWVEGAKKELTATNDEVAKEAMSAWIAAIPTIARCRPALLHEVMLEVLKTIPKPFAELRAFAWQLLEHIMNSGVKDVQAKILCSQEIRDNLLDFQKETTYDAKVAKHGFVKSVAALSWLGDFLTPELEQVLSAYAKGGPFYSPINSTVDVAKRTIGN